MKKLILKLYKELIFKFKRKIDLDLKKLDFVSLNELFNYFETDNLDKNFQHYCFNNIAEITTHKGIQDKSYIAFIKKK